MGLAYACPGLFVLTLSYWRSHVGVLHAYSVDFEAHSLQGEGGGQMNAAYACRSLC